jgi:hypothetical protein
MGSDRTHWRTGTWGMTWSTRCAAVCAMRRAPQDGPVAFETYRGLSRAIEKRPQRVDPIGKCLLRRLSRSIEIYRWDALHPASVLIALSAGVLCLSACDKSTSTPPKPKLIQPVPAEPGPIANGPPRVSDTFAQQRRFGALLAQAVDRGLLRAGAFADVVVFDPAGVQDHTSVLAPLNHPSGFVHVMVNGSLVVRDGVRNDECPGRVLRNAAGRDVQLASRPVIEDARAG